VRLYLEKTHHKKRDGGVAQGVGPEFKPQYHKKKKREMKEFLCAWYWGLNSGPAHLLLELYLSPVFILYKSYL
jgi:hypothetical protein